MLTGNGLFLFVSDLINTHLKIFVLISGIATINKREP